MGKHAPRRAAHGIPLPVLVVLGVLAVAAATFAVRSAWVGGADGATGDSTTATTTATATSAVTTTPTEPEEPSEPAPSEPPPTVPAPEPPAELGACQGEIAAGETLAAAAAVSADHWYTHTQAQLRFAAGEYTLEEAQADWSSTKVLGPEDLQRFSDAKVAYDAVYGSCTTLAQVADVPAELQDGVTACVARSVALNAVGAWGTAVNDDWAEHLSFMDTRPDADEVDYLGEWEGQVAGAPENYVPYLDAVAALAAAPACPVA